MAEGREEPGWKSTEPRELPDKRQILGERTEKGDNSVVRNMGG